MSNPHVTSTARAVRCPECASKGKSVKRVTLQSLLTSDAAATIGDEQYRFCDAIDCDIVYFGENSTTFSKSDLTVRVGVKERTAPRHVCYCFDHTIEEIEEEVRATGTSTVLDDIKTRMKTACWCETMSPPGSCCLGTVSKYIKKAMAENGSGVDPRVIEVEHADCCAAGSHSQSQSQSEESVMHNCCSNTQSDEVDTNDNSQRTGLFAAGGSLFSALAASACCWLPLLLIAFGVSAGGVSAWFAEYRWPFLGLTAILLGIGFYFIYFRKQHCAAGAACATPSRKLQRFNRVMLWVATVVVIATAAFPQYVGFLIPANEPAPIDVPAEHVTIAALGIGGMTCEACAVHLNSVLAEVPGVLDVSVSYDDGSATITFDEFAPPSSTSLATAVEGAGYQADTSSLSDKPADQNH